MKTKTLKTLGIAALVAFAFASCTGLKKMVKKADLVKYTVTPNPLEMHGDTVSVTVKGTFPEKYFGKKCTLTIEPTVKWNGGEKKLKPILVYGEKVKGASGQVVQYKTGGGFSYTDKVAYQPEMHNCELYYTATGQVKKKTKKMPEKKIADGTIDSPLLVKSDEMPIIGKDNFVKVVPMVLETEIFFVINQSTVRPTETNGKAVTDLKKFIENNMNNSFISITGMNISAYASPDGEMTLNSNLANDRAASSMKYFMNTMFKDKKTKMDAGQNQNFYKTVTTAEDWDGFERLVKESTDPKVAADRDIILNVLKLYPNGDVREKEIKNLSKTYTQLSDKILPKLRRSVNGLTYDKKSRTDEMLSTMCFNMIDSLSVEELLYAATLFTDVNKKLTVYQNAEKKYPNDWRCANNVGCAFLMLNKLNDAESAFGRANKLSANNPIIMNNMGIVAAWKGDRKTAADYYSKAKGAGPEVGYNMGILDIKNGNYSGATSNFGSYKTFNSALALMLGGNNDGAMSTVDGSKEKDDAMSYYLKAIIGARQGKTDVMINNLKTAIQKDASLKEKAKTDMEFFKMRDNAEFKSLVG